MIHRDQYQHDYPPHLSGMSEIHIFLAPLNPDEETLQRYYDAVDEFNSTIPGDKHQMKACHLSLNYREKGDIRVMQSSRYMFSKETQAVIDECYRQGQWFTDRGFQVIRHKIECLAYSTKGVPATPEAYEAFPNRYFEFHIRVRRADSDGSDEEEHPITDNEIQLLKDIAQQFTLRYNTPIPLSFNSNKRGQRYLNARFANCGVWEAKDRVDQIMQAIEDTEELKWVKTISEYVWYDDHRGVDSGWIDFTDEEKQNLLHITA
eukprot:TRINITY_DN9070_c0_g1_i1.p1 TRINITY_DN9070_c0_g1~~TRINITY_DN9070_c0_g1_i1.p1  ORF type:complete len:262 (-),score=56.37 TRINITY_DN9070_c0_g1_i1:15-800(-)